MALRSAMAGATAKPDNHSAVIYIDAAELRFIPEATIPVLVFVKWILPSWVITRMSDHVSYRLLFIDILMSNTFQMANPRDYPIPKSLMSFKNLGLTESFLWE